MSYASQVASEKKQTKSIVREMECGGLKASLMQAQRLKGDGLHGLPPGSKVDVFPIAALPGCPESWVRATGTYICPVDTEKGLWFNWTMNDRYNTAIIPSVKGMNPITGQKIDHIGMEQYINKCPIHGIDFGHDRYCEKCDYKWPPQNYVCYPDTLWWDGFRSSNGSVRQFFFTEDEKRDIASLVIGKENTVPAFGFVFYRTKVQRNITPPNESRGNILIGSGAWAWKNNAYMDNMKYGAGGYGAGGSAVKGLSSNHYDDAEEIMNSIDDGDGSKTAPHEREAFCSVQHLNSSKKYLRSIAENMVEPKRSSLKYETKTSSSISLSQKEVSVGGGARINQSLSVDPLALDGWCEKETALIRLYFVFEPQFREIVEKGGIKNISGTDTGYLSGLPLG